MANKNQLSTSRQYKQVFINHDQAHTDRLVTSNFRAILNALNQDTLKLKGSRVIYSSEPQRRANINNSRNTNVHQDHGQPECENRSRQNQGNRGGWNRVHTRGGNTNMHGRGRTSLRRH